MNLPKLPFLVETSSRVQRIYLPTRAGDKPAPMWAACQRIRRKSQESLRKARDQDAL